MVSQAIIEDCARRAVGAASTGLVSLKNKGNAPYEFRELDSLLRLGKLKSETVNHHRDYIQIDSQQRRVTRMKKGICHAARLLDFDSSADRIRYRRTFTTLTYRDARDWKAQHVNEFRRRLNQWCVRKDIKCRFVWCAELQKRGALHYHVLVWIPRRYSLPKPDKQGWWTHGSTNIKEARNAVAYIAKYASKTDSKAARDYPKGARMHGAGGLDSESRRALRYWQAPEFVRVALTGRADIRKVTGGYCDKITGEFLPSPWHIEFTPGGGISCWRDIKPETIQ